MQKKELLVQSVTGGEILFTEQTQPLVQQDRATNTLYLPYRYGTTNGRLIVPNVRQDQQPFALVERNPYPSSPDDYSPEFPERFITKMWEMTPPVLYVDPEGITTALIYPSITDAMLRLESSREAERLKSHSFDLKQQQYFGLLLSFISQINPTYK
jgi:hypothetical protein